jgi:integrase
LARLRRVPTAIDPGAYFFGRPGRPVSRHQIEYDWRCALVAAGVPHRAPENLRHTWISLLLSRGGNLLKLQKAGGWASATVLLTHYAAAEPDASDAPEAESALPARSLSAK